MNNLTTLENLSVNFEPGTIDFPQAEELKKLVADKLEQTKGLVATDESIKATKASRAEINKLKKALLTSARNIKKRGTYRLNSSSQRSAALRKIVTVRRRNSNWPLTGSRKHKKKSASRRYKRSSKKWRLIMASSLKICLSQTSGC